jgi:hypothetical protein
VRAERSNPPETAAPLRSEEHLIVRYWITPHAVKRYVERVDRQCSPARARAILVDMVQRAHFVKIRANGQELWRGPPPRRIRLLVTRQGDVMVLESVLFAFDR